MSEITPELVRHLGVLARIQLDDDEVQRLTGQLSVIVDNIAKVSEVATPDVPATSHPIPLENVFRPDVVGDMLTVEQVLQELNQVAEASGHNEWENTSLRPFVAQFDQVCTRIVRQAQEQKRVAQRQSLDF